MQETIDPDTKYGSVLKAAPRTSIFTADDLVDSLDMTRTEIATKLTTLQEKGAVEKVGWEWQETKSDRRPRTNGGRRRINEYRMTERGRDALE